MHFRGLRRLHSRYGPPDLSATQVDFCSKLRPGQLPSQATRQLPDLSTTIRLRSSLTDGSRRPGALPASNILCRAGY